MNAARFYCANGSLPPQTALFRPAVERSLTEIIQRQLTTKRCQVIGPMLDRVSFDAGPYNVSAVIAASSPHVTPRVSCTPSAHYVA